jgi:hypothetical protein
MKRRRTAATDASPQLGRIKMNQTKTYAPSFVSRLAAAGVLLLSGAASAQTADPSSMDHAATGHDSKGMDMKGMDHQGGGMAGMGGMDHQGGGMAGMMRKMLCGVTEHVDGRLAYLKAELKLTDQQQAAWTTFTDAYRASIQKTAQKCAAMGTGGGEHADHSMHKGVLGHLAMMDKHMGDHLESVRGLEAAIAPLYAALTDEQKKTADEVFAKVMDVGMSMGGGH